MKSKKERSMTTSHCAKKHAGTTKVRVKNASSWSTWKRATVFKVVGMTGVRPAPNCAINRRRSEASRPS